MAVAAAGSAFGEYGSVSVAGGLTLAGRWMSHWSTVTARRPGDSIPIITFDSSTGQFATLNVSNLPGGVAANLVYDPNDVTLSFSKAVNGNVVSTASAAANPGPGPRDLATAAAGGELYRRADGVSPFGKHRLRRPHFPARASDPVVETGVRLPRARLAGGHGKIAPARRAASLGTPREQEVVSRKYSASPLAAEAVDQLLESGDVVHAFPSIDRDPRPPLPLLSAARAPSRLSVHADLSPPERPELRGVRFAWRWPGTGGSHES